MHIDIYLGLLRLICLVLQCVFVLSNSIHSHSATSRDYHGSYSHRPGSTSSHTGSSDNDGDDSSNSGTLYSAFECY